MDSNFYKKGDDREQQVTRTLLGIAQGDKTARSTTGVQHQAWAWVNLRQVSEAEHADVNAHEGRFMPHQWLMGLCHHMPLPSFHHETFYNRLQHSDYGENIAFPFFQKLYLKLIFMISDWKLQKLTWNRRVLNELLHPHQMQNHAVHTAQIRTYS